MGLLADFVVASAEDALKYESFIGKTLPREQFERCEYKNYTNLELELLFAILRNEEWDVKRHELEVVNIGQGGESWLFRFPDEFVTMIANLEEGTVKRIAGTWAASCDVPGDADDNEPVIRDLKRLAIHAQASGRSLYLWGSL